MLRERLAGRSCSLWSPLADLALYRCECLVLTVGDPPLQSAGRNPVASTKMNDGNGPIVDQVVRRAAADSEPSGEIARRQKCACVVSMRGASLTCALLRNYCLLR